MTAEDWEKVEKAYQLILKLEANKIEGDKWLIYRLTFNIIRIDIKVK